MAVTLEWVRDNYDANRDRHIDDSEKFTAFVDWAGGDITIGEWTSVLAAYDNQTLLPAYGTSVSQTTDVTSIIIQTGSTLKVDGVEVI